jgi:AcrR family transcriptional regulator
VTSVKRPYNAPIRQQQATATKRRIALAAAAEFAQHGWAGATVAAIAARAKVTPQAVHLTVGGKAALLVRAVEVAVAGDADDVLLADRPAFSDVYADGRSARRRLAALAAVSADLYQRAARLFLVLHEAARHDPVAAELARDASARRLADHRRLATLLLGAGSEEQVAALTDAIWVLAGPGVYVDLVHQRQWPVGTYTAWLTGQLEQALRTATRGPR